MAFKVVSWNIELGLNIEQAAGELLGLPSLSGADILLAQELSPAQAHDLGRRLAWSHHYFGPAIHPKTKNLFGNAVFSPWPLKAIGGSGIPHTAPIMGQPRAVTVATVTIDGRVVTACSTHIETALLSLQKRVSQVSQLAEKIDELLLSNAPLIVGGDFNTASKRSQRALGSALDRHDLRRATDAREPTFRRFGRNFTLDHIFSRSLRPRHAGVASEANASDHRPVWATFDFQ